MAAANALMVYALLAHDFSVSYVAHVGSRVVPTWVSVVSLWSSLEGSILFWGLVLGRLHGRGHLRERRPPPRVHALRHGGLARLRRLLQLPAGGAGAAVPHAQSRAERRTGAEPPPAEPHPDGDPPAVPLLGLRRDDDPLRPGLRGPAQGPARPRLPAAAADVAAASVDLPDLRHRAGRAGGPTRSSAGAATGPGIRSRTRRSSPGSPPPPRSTRPC